MASCRGHIACTCYYSSSSSRSVTPLGHKIVSYEGQQDDSTKTFKPTSIIILRTKSGFTEDSPFKGQVREQSTDSPSKMDVKNAFKQIQVDPDGAAAFG